GARRCLILVLGRSAYCPPPRPGFAGGVVVVGFVDDFGGAAPFLPSARVYSCTSDWKFDGTSSAPDRYSWSFVVSSFLRLSSSNFLILASVVCISCCIPCGSL